MMFLSIAQKHSVTAAQVLIKWGLQKGLCVCVKSSNASRMAENLKSGGASTWTTWSR